MIRLWRKLLCSISDGMLLWLHRPRIIQEFDEHRRKIQCIDCETYFAMSDIHRAIIPWDEDYERIICEMYDLPRTKK